MANTKSLPIVEDCKGCGVCCLHMGYPAFQAPVESSCDTEYWRMMPEKLRNELIEFISAYSKPSSSELDGPCLWLDLETRNCKHHEFRPSVCRRFQIGSDGCREWRRYYSEQIISEGSTQQQID